MMTMTMTMTMVIVVIVVVVVVVVVRRRRGEEGQRLLEYMRVERGSSHGNRLQDWQHENGAELE